MTRARLTIARSIAVAGWLLGLAGCVSEVHNLTNDDAGVGGDGRGVGGSVTWGLGGQGTGGTLVPGLGGTGPNGAGGQSVSTDCATLASAAACSSVPGCASIVSTDGRFWECRQDDCRDGEITCARPTGTSETGVEFPTACVPSGWSTVAPYICDLTGSCAGRPARACLPESRCAPLQDMSGQFRGCGPRGATCPAVPTCATNGTITTVFPSGCLADGFNSILSTNPGCVIPPVPPGVAVYLAEGIDTGANLEYQAFDPTMASLVLPPVLVQTDIVTYDSVAHVFDLAFLSSDFFARVGQISVYGKPFVVTVDGARLFGGWFWTDVSSISCWQCLVLREWYSGLQADQIRLEYGYPTAQEPPAPDPRNDPRLLQALAQAGKLAP